MKLKKFISLLASLAMMVTAVTGAMSVSVSAADTVTYATSGTCGDDARWVLSDDGTLSITGTGEITSCTPRFEFSNSVVRLIVGEGITKIPSAFTSGTLRNLTEIILPSTLKELNFYIRYCVGDVYIYSKDITVLPENSACLPDPGKGTVMHLYKDSNTEKCFRSLYDYTDEDIVYIEGKRPADPVLTPATVEPLKETSGPAGLASKWEWNETSKTLTFSGKGVILIDVDYKKYAEKTEHIVMKSGITSIITVPDNLKESTFAMNGAFAGFTALKDVELPDTLVRIGGFSFFQTPLTKIELPATLEYIGFRAFRETNLEEVTFPDSLNRIEESAFSYTNIKSINLHEGMTIGGGAFNSCESLKEVTIPKNVFFVRMEADGAGMAREHCTFANCTGLEKIVIEDGCRVSDAFSNLLGSNGIVENFCQNCTSLKTVVIKGSINYIATRAFENCPLNDIYLYTTELSTVTAKGTDTGTVHLDSFEFNSNQTFHVVKGSTTEKTLRAAGYLTADNIVYLADTTALETAIADAEAIETDKYTDESVSEFTKAIESAKSVLENLDATQDEVDNAVKAIEDAKNALAEKPDEPSSDNSSDYSSDPSNSSGNNNQSQSPNTPATPSTSAPKTATPQPVTPPTVTTTAAKPAKVKAVKVKAKKNKLNVSWKKVSGATGYEVLSATNNKFTKNKKSVTVKKNKVTLKRLKSKKKYFVKVRAYKLANGRKYFGKWSKVVKKKTK